MNHYAPLLCTEFKLLVQEVLDGQEVPELSRRRIREHRDSCDLCCNFHDGLLGVAALAPEIDPPEEYRSTQSSRLWNQIVNSIAVVPPANPVATTLPLLDEPTPPSPPDAKMLSKLDVTKIHVDEPTEGKYFDLAKFLFGPDEMSCLGNMISNTDPNARIDRVHEDTYRMLHKLQDMVSDLSSVVGTMVLAPDGSVLDARPMRDQTVEDMGVWSTAAYHNAQAAATAFGFNRVTQVVSRTETGYVIIANLMGLTLIVLIEGDENEAWSAVARLGSVAK